jgi:hypothetical protein
MYFEFDCEPKVLQLIANYCKFLERFQCEYWTTNLLEKDFNEFGLKCSQRLEYFSYDYINGKRLKAFMPSINNIKKLYIKYKSLKAKDLMEERFSKVEEIGFKLSDLRNMVLFTDHFHSKIKKLSICFNGSHLTQNIIRDYLLQICRFENLNQLKLDFNYITKHSPIDESLGTVGNKLLKLKYLLIEIYFPNITEIQESYDQNRVLIKGDLFPILAQFKTIQYLKIYHKSREERFGPIKSLKSCKNLKYLSIISNFRDFSDEEIEEYKFHFSGLSYLKIDCCNRKFFL